MDQIADFISQIGFGWAFFAIIIVLFYFFWRECKILSKDNNSIFDIWFFGMIFMMLWGRLSYITSRWEEFMASEWFYSPYEFYGDKIYWFRLLPWKIFAVWDGFFLFTGLMAGFLLFMAIYITFMKKWSWKEMFRPVFSIIYIFSSLLLIIYSLLQKDYAILPLIGVIFFLSLLFLEMKRLQKNLQGKKLFWIEGILSTVIILLLGWVYLRGGITLTDYFNLFIVSILNVYLLLRYYKQLKSLNVSIEYGNTISVQSPSK